MIKRIYLGSIAGIVEHVGMFPLDTVKVKIRIHQHFIIVPSTFFKITYVTNSLNI
jgi:hypothetical protein